MVNKVLYIFVSVLIATSAKNINYESLEELQLLADLIQVQPYIFESKILEAIYKLKDTLKNGDSSNGVPPLDPFFLPQEDFDFILDDSKLEGYFENVIFSNFSDFDVLKVKFSLLPLHFKIDITMKELNINGRYKLAGDIFPNIPINGTGHFTSETKNLNLSLYVRPTTVNSSLQIKDLIFDLKALSQKIIYTNELKGNKTEVLDNNIALQFLDKIHETYIDSLLETTKLVLNHFLLGYTSGEIIKIILDLINNN